MRILKVHMIEQVITKNGFQCLLLYQMTSSKEPFHDQWYHREDGTEPCGHSI